MTTEVRRLGVTMKPKSFAVAERNWKFPPVTETSSIVTETHIGVVELLLSEYQLISA